MSKPWIINLTFAEADPNVSNTTASSALHCLYKSHSSVTMSTLLYLIEFHDIFII